MPFTTAGLNAGATGIGGAGRYISLHTADPGGTGASEVTGGSYARQQTTWGTASGGSTVGSQVAIPVPAGTTVTYWGINSIASGVGTFLYGGTLGAGETFGSAGTLNHTPTITVS